MITVIEYTPIDGRDHHWDDLGEAVRTIAYHYWRLLKTIVADVRGRR